MSGATLAAGPRAGKTGELRQRIEEQGGSVGGVMGSLRIVELQLVAFIVVFSASGLVPLLDLVFPVFVTLYALVLSNTVFPKYSKDSSAEVFKGNRLFQMYVVVGTIVGLFLPLAYVLGGFARGDQEAVRAATPHLFLLSFQVLSENLISGMSIFSLPVRAILPILYTGRRLFSLTAWLNATFRHEHVHPPPHHHHSRFPHARFLLQDNAWVWFGRGLALANFVYYSLNLFAFLIPMFLPRALERYFEDQNVHRADKKAPYKGAAQNGHSDAAVNNQKKAA